MSANTSESMTRRIAVVLRTSDAARSLLDFLQPLLEKEKETETSLQCFLIENDEVQQAAALPFVKELCRLTLSVRDIQRPQFERILALRTRTARRAFSSLALSTGVSHSFRTIRGSTNSLLRETAGSADITIFEPLRIFTAPMTTLPTPRRHLMKRIVAAIDDLHRCAEILIAAASLARGRMQGITVLITDPTPIDADTLRQMIGEVLPARPERILVLPNADTQDLIATVHSERANMLVIGASKDVLEPESLQPLLKQLRCPICLVRQHQKNRAT